MAGGPPARLASPKSSVCLQPANGRVPVRETGIPGTALGLQDSAFDDWTESVAHCTITCQVEPTVDKRAQWH